MNKSKNIKKLSLISILHYSKLIFRSCLFIIALSIYLLDKTKGVFKPLIRSEIPAPIIIAVWWIFIIEMIFRFFPSSLESMGCQKQFSRNYISTGNSFRRTLSPGESKHSLAIVILSWVLLNTALFSLFFMHIIDEGILLLIALGYSVCDMICILFFCPFQEWMMKNKCCGTCRIYNWDYAMMFTPLIFVKSIYSWSLLVLSLLLLIKWEIDYSTHPERFYENSNAALSCKNCSEKLCSHKKSLRLFLVKRNEQLKHK